MTKVAVLAGGTSEEREVSQRSGTAVAAALQTAGYEVVMLDPAHPTDEYESQITAADVAFPIVHGKFGEDGSLQKYLEERDIPFVGADSQVSALCFNKWTYKNALLPLGIQVPHGEIVSAENYVRSGLITKPFVLKPVDGGSSIDTFIVRDPRTFDHEAIEHAFSRHPEMLLEQLIEGQEITVGVLMDAALPVIEIIPPTESEFDFLNKYNGKTQEICPPQHIDPAIQKSVQDIALLINSSLGIRDLSRTDMIIDSGGNPWVLETNTLQHTGMTDQSLLPKSAAVAGYDMPKLCSALVETALARGTAR